MARTQLNDRHVLPNGWTVGFTRNWTRACRWAKRYCIRHYKREWDDPRVAHEYMSARNGYLAGFKAGLKSKRKTGKRTH